jgi:hypothetical protein
MAQTRFAGSSRRIFSPAMSIVAGTGRRCRSGRQGRGGCRARKSCPTARFLHHRGGGSLRSSIPVPSRATARMHTRAHVPLPTSATSAFLYRTTAPRCRKSHEVDEVKAPRGGHAGEHGRHGAPRFDPPTCQLPVVPVGLNGHRQHQLGLGGVRGTAVNTSSVVPAHRPAPVRPRSAPRRHRAR